MDKTPTVSDIKAKVEEVAISIIKQSLDGKVYSPTEATNLSNNISTDIIAGLKDKYDKYKFMLSTLIMQKGESGLSLSGACLWDSKSDGNSVVMQENNHLICIVNIYFVHL